MVVRDMLQPKTQGIARTEDLDKSPLTSMRGSRPDVHQADFGDRGGGIEVPEETVGMIGKLAVTRSPNNPPAAA